MKVIIVTGASGGGKTTLCELLHRHLPNHQVRVISADWCYRDPAAGEDPTTRNYDHPAAFDYDTLCEGILSLRAGQPYNFPVYDYKVHRRDPVLHNRVEPGDVIVVEGILLLYTQKLREIADFAVYVHADLDICLARRILRDTRTRGRTVESVIEQYFKHVRPAYFEFIYPTMHYADIVVPNINQIDDLLQNNKFTGLIELIEGRVTLHHDKKVDMARLMSSLHIPDGPFTSDETVPESGSGST